MAHDLIQNFASEPLPILQIVPLFSNILIGESSEGHDVYGTGGHMNINIGMIVYLHIEYRINDII